MPDLTAREQYANYALPARLRQNRFLIVPASAALWVRKQRSAKDSSIGHQLQSNIAAKGLTDPVIALQTIAVFLHAPEGMTTHNSPHARHLNELRKTLAYTIPNIGSVGFLHFSHCLDMVNSINGHGYDMQTSWLTVSLWPAGAGHPAALKHIQVPAETAFTFSRSRATAQRCDNNPRIDHGRTRIIRS